MPNNDLISRKALSFEIFTKSTLYDGLYIGKGIGLLLNKSEVLGRIEAAPAVDAEPVRHGKWEIINRNEARCSECKIIRNIGTQTGWNFCPNCGAKMDKE